MPPLGLESKGGSGRGEQAKKELELVSSGFPAGGGWALDVGWPARKQVVNTWPCRRSHMQRTAAQFDFCYHPSRFASLWAPASRTN